MSLAITATPEDIDRIAHRVAEIILAQSRPTANELILTRPEARAYVKRKSEAAFCEWCQRWDVSPVSRGRYSRLALDRAIDRESRAGRRGSRISAHPPRQPQAALAAAV